MKFQDKRGAHIPLECTAEKIAEYLADSQWKGTTPLPDTKDSLPDVAPPNLIKDTDFTMDELNHVINKQANRKLGEAADQAEARWQTRALSKRSNNRG